MSKIMIMTASTGGGHNQVAMTLESELEKRGHSVKRVDFIKEENKMLELIVEEGYELLAGRFPKLYGEIYKISNRANFDSHFADLLIRAERRRTWEIIREEEPDLIIGTHPFAVKLIGSLKKKNKTRIPFISIVTDFEAHQAYIDNYVDAYVTGSRHTRAGLVKKGIDQKKIHPLGIPIKAEFQGREAPGRAGRHRFTILLMGGSMGLKGIKRVLSRLMSMEEDIFVNAVCGNNVELKARLEEKHHADAEKGRLEIHGFVDNISELMDDADVIITKPGGLTVSESIAKRLPMIIPFFIPGQEEENADFLELREAAIKLGKEDDIRLIVRSMMDNPELLSAMRKNMEQMGPGDAVEGIMDLVDELLGRKVEEERIAALLGKEIEKLGIYNIWTAVQVHDGYSVEERRFKEEYGVEAEADMIEKVFIEDFYDEEAFKRDSKRRCPLI